MEWRVERNIRDLRTMLTRVVGLVSGMGWHVCDLARAAKRVGVPFVPVTFSDLASRLGTQGVGMSAGRSSIEPGDALLVRMMPPGSLEQVVFRMDLLHMLEAHGRLVVNCARAIEASVDKYLALARLRSAGLPVPETWVGERSGEALRAFDFLGGDVVVKPLFGSEGRGMVRVSDRETAGRVFRALERVGSVLYLQQFVSHEGFDIRAFVIGDYVVAAMRRYAKAPDWRANLAQGARAEAVVLEDDVQQLVIHASQTLGTRVAGVDVLPAADGRLLILEVNAVPGWRGLASVSGVDLASSILSDIKQLDATRHA
jgi:ribosomal protein S6--L-glutamate ligase